MDRIIGRMPVLEALKKGGNIERVFIQDTISGEFEIEIRNLCKKLDVPLNRVPKARLDREVDGNHQGIYALASLVSYQELEPLLTELESKNKKLILVILDGVKDVRNLGAIARSAEVFGADALILPSRKTAPVNDIAIKASAVALLHLPICRVNSLQQTMDVLGRHHIVLIGADTEGNEELSTLDLKESLAIVLGEEDKGIDKHLKVYFDHHFHIPQVGKTESLNVSVAAGIILYEVSKQRH